MYAQYERFHGRGNHFETGQILEGNTVFVRKFQKN